MIALITFSGNSHLVCASLENWCIGADTASWISQKLYFCLLLRLTYEVKSFRNPYKYDGNTVIA